MDITLEDFKKLVPDEGIRKYILNDLDEDEVFSDFINYIKIYQNTINLAFIYAFSCYLDLKNNLDTPAGARLDECIRYGNSNSLRVIRTMQNIYKKYPLTNELMQFVLADIYYDFIQGENACLQDFFPYCVSAGDYWYDKGFGLNDYFAFINENSDSVRVEKDLLGKEFTHESAQKYLKVLLGFFPFLRCVSLSYDEDAGWYVFKIQDYQGYVYRKGIIDTFGLIRKFVNNGRNFFFMSAIENDVLLYETPWLDRYISCKMVGLNGETVYSKKEAGVINKPYNIPTDYETVVSYLDSEVLATESEPVTDATVGQLFNINYKYLKNLALSIADVIGKECYRSAGQRLRETFAEQYPIAFENYNDATSNWDNIVVILLMEVGPSMVLREVFYELNDSGDSEVIRNLRRRFGVFIQEVFDKIRDGREFTKRAKELLGNRYINDARSDRIKNYNRELMAKAKTQIVLSALLEAESKGGKKEIDCFHTDTIQQYIILLKSIEGISDKQAQCDMVERLLKDTFKRIICFYEGIFAYSKVKIDFDSASRKKLLSSAEIKSYQDRAESSFFNCARKKAGEISALTAVELIAEFVRLCEECYKVEISTSQIRSKNSKYLYAVLGKNSIMNVENFSKIIDIKNVSAITASDADWWVSVAIEILQFLSVGILNNDKGAPRLFNAIAPMVASYNNHSDSKDGYDTATFALIFDANEIGGETMEIKMLSEFSYEVSMRYYCLPNVIRSNNKWWIDPFVISCKDFDKIFLEG